MNDKRKSTPKASKSSLFGLGAFLFAVGIAGGLWSHLTQPVAKLAALFPQDTVFFAEISLNETTLDRWDETFAEADVAGISDSMLAKYLPQVSRDTLEPWIGARAGVALLPNQEFLFAARYRSKSKAKDFLQSLALPNEMMTEHTVKDITVLTPAFSSPLTFKFTNGWLVIGSSMDALVDSLDAPSLLNNKDFLACAENFSNHNDAVFFAKSSALLDSSVLGEKFVSQEPILRAFADTVPALGATVTLEKDRSLLEMKFVTTEGVFSADQKRNTPNEMLPKMAQFSPRDSLFFMNGHDLYAKYEHTREFLGELHPQFSVVFDGLLRSEFGKIFGEDFDFEEDFLKKMHGQYGLILDFDDAASPAPHFTLVTGFGGANVEENAETLHHVIRSAQSQVATQIVERTLVDGSSREELMAVDPLELEIRKKLESEHTYFTVASPAYTNDLSNASKKFSYGFLNEQLVFSSHERGVANVMRSFDTANANLANNDDFRQSVLFDFVASESFGYFNLNKLRTLLDFSQTLIAGEETTGNTWSAFLHPFRNISFSRKNNPRATYFSGVLRRR